MSTATPWSSVPCAFTEGGDCDGAAYVFVRSGSTWTEQAKLLPADLAKFDRFGSAVAISGDTIVIGSHHDTTGAFYRHGSAYVFVRSGETWTERAKLTTPVLDNEDDFGTSVDIDGHTIVVGAPYRNSESAPETGAAYVYERAGRAWTFQAELRPAQQQYLDDFGRSVAVQGDTVLAGAPFADPAGQTQAGAAYAFVRADSTWQQAAEIVPKDADPASWFGAAVALDGTTAAIGNGYEGEVVRSAVYVFVGGGSNWTQQAKLTGRGGTDRNEFGSTLDLSGNTIAVGARAEDSSSFDSGAAYVFKRKSTTWKQRARLSADPASIGGRFGSDVAVDDRTLAVGHRGEDEVYAYRR